MKGQKIVLIILLVIWILLLAAVVVIHHGIGFSQSVQVFFAKSVSEENNSCILVPVERIYKSLPLTEKKIQFAVEELIKGPDSAEQSGGLLSLIPPESKILDVKLENGILYLDFDEAIESGGGIQDMKTRLAQIVYTATQYTAVSKVRFLINGNQIKSFSGEGITEVEKPLTNPIFRNLEEQDERKDTSRL